MKKLLSILTISTLSASVPAPLMAMKSSDDEWEIINKDDIPSPNRVKRDVVATEKDVTTGFDIKTKENIDLWQVEFSSEEPFKKADNKWYIVIFKTNKWNIVKFKNDVQLDRWNNKRNIATIKDGEDYNLNLEAVHGNYINLIIRSL